MTLALTRSRDLGALADRQIVGNADLPPNTT